MDVALGLLTGGHVSGGGGVGGSDELRSPDRRSPSQCGPLRARYHLTCLLFSNPFLQSGVQSPAKSGEGQL